MQARHPLSFIISTSASRLSLLYLMRSSLSLILYSCRRLRREIVKNTIYAGNLCDDALNEVVDQLVRQVLDGDFHDIGGVDGTNDARPVEGALAVLDAGGLEVRNGSWRTLREGSRRIRGLLRVCRG